MKKTLSLILGLIFASSTLLAQSTERKDMTPEERANKMTDKMSEKLSLNEADTEKLRSVNLDFMNEVSAIKQDKDLEKEERKSKLEEARSSHKADLKTVLSAEDFSEYEAWETAKKEKRELKKEMQDKSPSERALQRTIQLDELVKLTPKQKEQVLAIIEKVEMKIDAIHKDETKSKEQKREHIKGNRKDQRHAIKQILTEEQLNTLKEAKKERKEQH